MYFYTTGVLFINNWSGKKRWEMRRKRGTTKWAHVLVEPLRVDRVSPVWVTFSNYFSSGSASLSSSLSLCSLLSVSLFVCVSVCLYALPFRVLVRALDTTSSFCGVRYRRGRTLNITLRWSRGNIETRGNPLMNPLINLSIQPRSLEGEYRDRGHLTRVAFIGNRSLRIKNYRILKL